MGANSAIRRAAKTLLYPLTNDKTYKYVQAASKALDIKKGTWSEPELDLVKLGLREGETTLDVGANFGIYSYYMSRAVGRTGTVYAFEPIPFTFETLKIVGKLLGFSSNVKFIEKGCGDSNGTINFSVPVQQSGAFSAGQAYIGTRNDDHDGKEKQVRWGATKEVEAEIIKLDDFLPTIDSLPFVKLDIEGAELLCLRGARSLFEKHLPTTVCEINPWFLEGFGLEMDDLTDYFFDLGYKLYFYECNQDKPRLREISAEDIVEDNYVFLHPRWAERFSSVLN